MTGTEIVLVTKEGEQTIDPARSISGMAPGNGQPVMPHVISFQSMAWSGARVYRASDEALRDSLENARYMRNDAGVMECVEQRQRSTALLDWHIEVDDESDPRQAGLRNEVTRLCEEIPYFTKYREALLNAIWYGRYAVANRFEWRWLAGRKYVAVADWLPLHGDKLVWRLDSDRERIGIRVGTGGGLRDTEQWRRDHAERIEPTDRGMAYFLAGWERDMLCLHQHIIEDGEYEDPLSAGRIHGVGIRSRIYWTWYQKQEALAWLMEFLERSGFGIEIWYYPYGNPEAEQKTRTAAQERIGQGRNIILVPRPLGAEGMAYGVERIEPGMSGAQALKDILTEYFGHQIKRYILGQTLTTEAQATGLGSNLASIHLDTYLQIIRYDAINLQETITRQLVRPLMRFNWPELADVGCRFVIELDSPDVESKLSAWKRAWEMGCRLREKDVMELIGAAMPTEDDRALENRQLQQPAISADAAFVEPYSRPVLRYGAWEESKHPRNAQGRFASAESGGWLSKGFKHLTRQEQASVAKRLSKLPLRQLRRLQDRLDQISDWGELSGNDAYPAKEAAREILRQAVESRSFREPISARDGPESLVEDFYGAMGLKRRHPKSGQGATSAEPPKQTQTPSAQSARQPAIVTLDGREYKVKHYAGLWFWQAPGTQEWVCASRETAKLIERQLDTGQPSEQKAATSQTTQTMAEQTVPEEKQARSQRVRRLTDAARRYGVPPDDLLSAAEFVIEGKQQQARARESAAGHARKLTGLTARDIGRLENSGYDYASAHKAGGATGGKFRQFEVWGQEVARQHPDADLPNPDDPGADFGRALWDLLREGKKRVPQWYDQDILDEAGELVLAAGQLESGETQEGELVPFSLRRKAIAYRKWAAR